MKGVKEINEMRKFGVFWDFEDAGWEHIIGTKASGKQY